MGEHAAVGYPETGIGKPEGEEPGMRKNVLQQTGIFAAALLLCAGMQQEISSANDGSDVRVTVRKLSDKECSDYTEFINGTSCYGFLLSEYTDPAYADLNQVFYNGCGVSERITDEEAAEINRDFMTDVTKLKTDAINEILQKRTGLTLSEMAKPFPWGYCGKYDFYYMEHGDTNYRRFTVKEGQWNNGRLELDCVADDRYGGGFSCRVVLKTMDSQSHSTDDLRFVSNRCTGKYANPSSGLPVYGDLYTKVNSYTETEYYYDADCTVYDSGFFSKKEFDTLKPGDIVIFEDHEEEGGLPHPNKGKVSAENEDGSLTVKGAWTWAVYRLTPEECTTDSGRTYYMRVLKEHAPVRIPKNLTVNPVGYPDDDAETAISMEEFLNDGLKLKTAFYRAEGNMVTDLTDYIGNHRQD